MCILVKNIFSISFFESYFLFVIEKNVDDVAYIMFISRQSFFDIIESLNLNRFLNGCDIEIIIRK